MSTSPEKTEIQPALTPEEWRSKTATRGDVELFVHVSGPETLYALAALCLHSQPFGFTWEDVDFLQYNAARARSRHGDLIAEAFDFDGLADRIAALLPPRGP